MRLEKKDCLDSLFSSNGGQHPLQHHYRAFENGGHLQPAWFGMTEALTCGKLEKQSLNIE